MCDQSLFVLLSADAEQIKERMKEYSTFQPPFSQEKIDFVLETAKANVKSNKETLMWEMNKAVQRRRNRCCS